MLTKEFVEKEISGDLNPLIAWAREYSNKCLRNIDGVKYLEYLEHINNYENEGQYKARKKLAISNKYLSEELLRPTDNAFNAKGGSKNYKFKSNEEDNSLKLIDKLANVTNGLTLSEYIKDEWFNRHLTDPNGLIFMEESKEGEERKTYPTYKSIQYIRNYQQEGMFVNWVIFEPHEEIEQTIDNKPIKIKIFYAVDEKFYYIYKIVNKELILKEKIKHSFDKVPAILCSNLINNVNGMKISPIDAQIELMDKYLISNSVLSISEFIHNYPVQWKYTDPCNQCNGTGKVNAYEIRQGETSTECKSCNGSGKEVRKDVTDILELRPPKKDDQKIDPPGGYIYMPTEPWELMTKSVDRSGELIFFSHWGTTVSKDAKNETATGRFLDAQPINNRLNDYSISIEKTHTALANFIGVYYFPKTFDRSFIQYGRRYLIETPDQIWEKYLKAKNEQAPDTTLDILLNQYLESEYRENEQMLLYEKKKTQLEPFIHQTKEQVRNSLYISDFDKAKKEYFNEWCKHKQINEITVTKLDKLQIDLDSYINEKLKENGKIRNENDLSQTPRKEES